MGQSQDKPANKMEDAEDDENLGPDATLSFQFFEACQRGDLAHVQALAALHSGVDLNYQHETTSHGPSTPWQAAAAGGHLAVLVFLSQLPVNKNATNEQGLNALHLAALDGHLEVIKYLHQHEGMSLNGEGRSALHWAALRSRMETAEFLLAHGAHVDHIPQNEWNDGQSPIFYASFQGKTEMVQLLLRHGARTDVVDTSGENAMFGPVIAGCMETVKVLVEAGMPVDHRNQKDETVFDVADSHGYGELAVYLWEMGARSKRPDRAPYVLNWQKPYIVNRISHRSAARCCVKNGWAYIFGGYGKPVSAKARRKFQTVPGGTADLPRLPLLASFDEITEIERKPTDPEFEWFFDVFRCNLREGVQSGPLFDLLPSKSISAAFTDASSQHDNIFNVDRMHPTLLRMIDPLTIEYTGSGMDWAGSVAAEVPFRREEKFNYFELTIVAVGERREIVIGVADKFYDLDSLPGWDYHSLAFHGDVGEAVAAAEEGEDENFDAKFTSHWHNGDVVGFGLIWETNEAFMTLNGEFVGVCYNFPEDTQEYYPIVGMRSKGAKAKANFGSQPFQFDFVVPFLAFQAYPTKVLYPAHNTVFVLPKLENPLLAPLEGEFFCLEFELLCVLSPRNPIGLLEQFSTFPTQASSTCPPRNTSGAVPKYCLIGRVLFVVYLNDDQPAIMWTLDLETLQWDGKHVLLPEGIKWGDFVGKGISLVPLGSKLVFFEIPDRTFIYDTATNEVSEVPSNKPPAPRVGGYNVTKLNESEMLVHAGMYKSNVSSESYVFNIDSLEWRTLRHTNGYPVRKTGSSSVMVDDKILYVGGQVSGFASNYIELVSISSSRSTSSPKFGLGQFWNSEILSTVEILPEPSALGTEKPIHAHHVILSTRSKLFRDVLGNTSPSPHLRFVAATAEAPGQVFVSPSIPFEIFTAIVKYLYTDEVDLVEDKARLTEFLRLAKILVPEHSKRISEMLILSRVHEKSSIYADLGSAFDSAALNDVNLDINGTVIGANKVVLSAESQYFKALFAGTLRREGQARVEMADSTPDVVRHVLRFIYFTTIDYEQIGDVIEEVLLTANKYGVVRLVETLESVISANLTETNVKSLLEVAEAHGFDRLKSSCQSYIAASTAH